MTFDSAVKSCIWNEGEGKWHVSIENVKTGQIKEEMADSLLGANGVLNAWKWPEEVEGLKTFKGRMIHTARWPEDYGEEQWKNERIAVLGSGASSIQAVPSMQPYSKYIEVFVRTPVWFGEIAGHSGDNTECKLKYRSRTLPMF
jgi:cation diffusion facilitator CzcD-associated flavoprotein CzcO